MVVGLSLCLRPEDYGLGIRDLYVALNPTAWSSTEILT